MLLWFNDGWFTDDVSLSFSFSDSLSLCLPVIHTHPHPHPQCFISGDLALQRSFSSFQPPSPWFPPPSWTELHVCCLWHHHCISCLLITVCTIITILTVSNTTLMSISWAMFIPLSRPADLLSPSVFTYWLPMCGPPSRMAYSRSVKSVGSVFIGLLRQTIPSWQVDRWLSNSEHMQMWLSATDILPIKSKCFGVTCLSVLFSQGPHQGLLPFSGPAVLSPSFGPPPPKTIVPKCRRHGVAPHSSSTDLLLDSSQYQSWIETFASLWWCPNLANPFTFLSSASNFNTFLLFSLVYVSIKRSLYLILFVSCFLCFIFAGWSLERRWVKL